jgi:hypothetical protein
MHMPRSIRRNQRHGPRRRRSFGVAASVLILALAFAAPVCLAHGGDNDPKPPSGKQDPPAVTTPPVTAPPATTTPPGTTTPPEAMPPASIATQPPPGPSSQAPAQPSSAAGSPPPAATPRAARGGPPTPPTARRQPRSSRPPQRAKPRPRRGTGARPARKAPRRAAAPALPHRSPAAHGGRSTSRSRTAAERAAGRAAQLGAGARRRREADRPQRANRPSNERVPEQLPLSEAESRASTPTPGATVAVPPEGLPWIAILLITTGAGLAVLLAVRLVGVTTRQTPAGNFTAPPGPTALRTGHLTSSSGHLPLVAPPSATAPLAPGDPAPRPQPTAAAAKGNVPLCEIQWESDEDGSWFVAVTTEDGEHEMLADSSTFAWRGADPPSRTPEARAALHKLIRQLEAAGWRSVHGHGRQHGQLRWYARRFLPPADWRQRGNTCDDPTDRAEVDIA